MRGTIATAELVRHLLPVPFVLFGLALARWAEPVARFYAKVFRGLGLNLFERAYESSVGIWYVRIAGLLFAAIALYWAIAGTG